VTSVILSELKEKFGLPENQKTKSMIFQFLQFFKLFKHEEGQVQVELVRSPSTPNY
jgi:hypothetical protein